MRPRRIDIISIILTCILLTAVSADPGVPLSEKFSSSLGKEIDIFALDSGVPQYSDYIDEYSNRRPSSFDEGSAVVSAGITTARLYRESEQIEKTFAAVGGSTAPALHWTTDIDSVEWTVEVPETGYYEIWLDYYMEGGSGSPAQRSVEINGETPFEESSFVYFRRIWTEDGPVRMNNVGDQVNPRQREISMWREMAVYDGGGFFPQPLKYLLKEGSNRIRLSFLADEMYVAGITLRVPKEIPAYDEVYQEYQAAGFQTVEDQITVQAEDTAYKTDPTLRRVSIADPAAIPYERGYKRLNGIGDWSWRNGGQAISWAIEVPESGMYSLAFKVGQWWGEGLPVFRTIRINGEVPFRELLSYQFEYSREFRYERLHGDDNEPLYIYFEEGIHELTMTVTLGPMRQLAKDLQYDSLLMAEMLRKITMITGEEPDLNFEYRLDEAVPGLMDDFEYLLESMRKQEALIEGLGERRPVVANNFAMIADMITEILADPDEIPRKMNDLDNAQKNLGAWLKDLQAGPMLMDFFVLGNPEAELPKPRSTLWQRTVAGIYNFFVSFTKDYDSVGSVFDEGETTEVIDVWVTRGKDWGELIKELADESFTTETGIGVNLNILPASQVNAGAINALLLAILSGNAPDVALGTDFKSPVEFAIRGASADLSQFEGFEEVTERFLDGVMIPFEFNGGYYGLPETNDFNVLIYRTDIFTDLGLPVPQTWEEVYKVILPVLRENGMDMFYPRIQTGFLPFLYQNQGDYYRDFNRRSGLDTPEAYDAFRQWTELYTNYKVPVQADFYNRFRTGSMPMGVGNYFTYVLISTAAPELRGRWSIAPLPGTYNDDGELVRSAGGEPQAAILIEQSDKKEAGWEFLKWWTSAEVQSQFGRELEALMGVEARWNTSNLEAFRSLPWDPEHLAAIEEQWQHFKEQPYVLGGYFTVRHVDNAWNRVVLGNMTVRDSLEKAVRDINRELQVKQEEFSYLPIELQEGEEANE